MTTMKSSSDTPPKLVLRVPWRDGKTNFQPTRWKHFDTELGRVVEVPTPRDRIIAQDPPNRGTGQNFVIRGYLIDMY